MPAIARSETIDLKPALREFLAAKANLVRTLSRRVVEDVIRIGEALSEVRAKLKNHGQWRAWVDDEFEWSVDTVENYIRVFEMDKANAETVRHWNIDVSALYLLARKSTPEPVKQEVIEAAKTGQRLNERYVKNLLRFQFAPSKDSKPKPAAPRKPEAAKVIERPKTDYMKWKEEEESLKEVPLNLDLVLDGIKSQKASVEEVVKILARHDRILHELVDCLPEALALLTELREALQKAGYMQRSSFGSAKPQAMKSGGPKQ